LRDRLGGWAIAKSNGQAAVRPNAEERVSRFMKTALAILGETGRTEFTVLEIAERSKTSLRSLPTLLIQR
jgi:hypothetical protein